MSVLKRELLSDIVLAIILYCTVIIYQGYQYGQSDQSQILPVLYAQDHPGTYADDHYVQAYLKSGINERTIFHSLFRHMGYSNSWIVFFWHALFSILLFLAWFFIASLFINNKALQWLAIALIVTIGFHTSTGSNELYYNQFIPSLAAKTLASWGLYYWLKEKYNGWVLLLLLATILQPLVGLHIFILTCFTIFIDRFLDKLKPLPWKQIVAYIVLAAPWIYLLAVNNGGQESPAAFMDIMEFRLSHHFFGTSFGLIHLLISAIFFSIAIPFYKKRLRWMFVIIAIGCIIYEIGVEVFRSPFFLYTQWWKTTIWLEAFALIAFISMMEKRFMRQLQVQKYQYAIPLTFLLLTGIYRFSGIRGERPLLMEPLSKNYNDDADISLKANLLTPENSVFIIPPELSAFKWHSKRSSYVDYKALFHQEEFLLDWYSRIKNIYEYDLVQERIGISVMERAKEIFENPDPGRIEEWKSMGITHYIGYSSVNSTRKAIAQNDTYSIYTTN